MAYMDERGTLQLQLDLKPCLLKDHGLGARVKGLYVLGALHNICTHKYDTYLDNNKGLVCYYYGVVKYLEYSC